MVNIEDIGSFTGKSVYDVDLRAKGLNLFKNQTTDT
jgi:hypothetical protein